MVDLEDPIRPEGPIRQEDLVLLKDFLKDH
jgi:hypothetical protein